MFLQIQKKHFALQMNFAQNNNNTKKLQISNVNSFHALTFLHRKNLIIKASEKSF